MLKFNKFFVGAMIAATVFTSCKKKDDPKPKQQELPDNPDPDKPAPEKPYTPTPGLVIPTDYDASSFVTNTTDVSLPSKLSDLKAKASEGSNINGTKVTVAQLKALYTFKSDVSTKYDTDLMQTVLEQIAEASGNLYTIEDMKTQKNKGGAVSKGPNGGYRLLDETGIEYIQILDKGLYGAALFNKAISTLKKDMTPADVDKVVKLFGNDGKFDAENNNGFLAKYAVKSSDKANKKGLYFDMKKACILLQAAVKANDAKFDVDKEHAIKLIKQTWEKALGARAIYYFLDANKTFSETSPTDGQKANALHAYSEGVGFMAGLSGIQGTIIDDTKLNALLKTVMFGDPVTSYKLITEPATSVAELTKAVKEIKSIYSFSAADMAMFTPAP